MLFARDHHSQGHRGACPRETGPGVSSWWRKWTFARDYSCLLLLLGTESLPVVVVGGVLVPIAPLARGERAQI